jgi:predicted nucleotidyltransferase
MNRQEAIAVLVQHRDDLRARGVRHAALFGSVARGDARPDSDLDILIELDPDAQFDVFEYAGLKMYIEGLFVGAVDVVNREALKSHLRPSIGADAVYAF